MIRSAKPSGFIAGADIKEFLKIRTPEEGYELVRAGQTVLQALEYLPCPSVAALHGFALGGGLELALACTYRVAADDAKLSLGLPEVLLGIHPGFGGTVRSVQLIGVRPALDLMLKGKPYKGSRALAVGLIDELVPPPALLERAKARLLRSPPKAGAPFVDQLLNLAAARPFVARQTASALRHTVRRDQYPAPYAILDLWQRHGAAGAESYEAEARSISELMCTPTSRNLVRVFMLQDRLKSLGGKSPAEFRHVHVIGAGVMGGDIAAWSAFRGMTVTLQDRSPELIQPAMDRAKAFFEKRLKDPAAAAAAVARLRMDVNGDGVADADVVIEAIFENVEAKRALYAQSSSRSSSRTPSSPPIPRASRSRPCARSSRTRAAWSASISSIPWRNCSWWKSCAAPRTQPQAVQNALQFTRKLDKLPLPCKSAPGFVVNRILTPYVNEALFALEGGIPAAVIDRAGKDFGMPMGPIELTDVVGLDVSLHVGRVLAEALQRRVPDISGQTGGAEEAGPQERRRILRMAGRQAGQARVAAIRRAGGSGGPADTAHAQ